MTLNSYKEAGVAPDEGSYNLLLDMYMRTRRIESAMALREKMSNEGVTVGDATWRLMAKVALKSRSVDQIHVILSLLEAEGVALTDKESDLMLKRMKTLSDGRYGAAANKALAASTYIEPVKLEGTIR